MKKKEFIELYDNYSSRIYRFIILKVNSQEDSEDLTSEAFFKFWESVKRKNKINNPKALLYKIAVNLVTDFYRKKSRKEISLDSKESILSDIRDKNDLNIQTTVNSDMDGIKKAISELKETHQNVIVWRYLDELSIKEISHILDKPEGSTRVLIHRAMKELKKKM